MPKKLVPIKTPAVADNLLADVRELIRSAREGVARAVNSGLVLLYWKIGKRIQDEILHGRRAKYGEEIVSALGRQLTEDFGPGFTRRNLFSMVRFAEVFPDLQIVHALSAQLGWTHLRQIIYLDDPLKRDFYAEMCRVERWSTRTLQAKINGMLFERTAISKKPAKLAAQELEKLRADDQLTPDLVFRDPYFLDFLGLKGAFHEKDLEAAIIRDLEAFLVELGGDFAFLARQKRITVDGEDFYLDLLFYHRGLRRLIAIDLKLGRFAPGDLGQMEFYLRWLKKHETRAGEHEPLGLILCAEKSDERIEVFELEARGIRIAEYFTELPPKELLEKKLHTAVQIARERMAANEENITPTPPAETKKRKTFRR